ncbi:hypothetical protein ABIB25_005756 [Nakamurella sp. UYEF19]
MDGEAGAIGNHCRLRIRGWRGGVQAVRLRVVVAALCDLCWTRAEEVHRGMPGLTVVNCLT